jgi:hypothetical protein
MYAECHKFTLYAECNYAECRGALYVKLSISDNNHNDIWHNSIKCSYVEFHYAEGRYVECRYA